MKIKIEHKKVLSTAITVILLCILLFIISNPSHFIEVSFSALSIWAKILVPSLLPFFIFTRIVSSLGTLKDITNSFGNITSKLYKVPKISFYVFFLSVLTGYPVGSKLVSDLYHTGEISKSDAKKIITFTSNSGPMFIIGSVGAGLFLSPKVGYIILISHILGAILNGLLYRNIPNDNIFCNKYDSKNNSENILSDSVMNSITSIMLVGGIVVISFIVIDIILQLNLFYPINFIFSKIGIDNSATTSILSGILEITKGCQLISMLNVSLGLKTTFACFVISFGGFSTILQAMAFLKEIVSYKFFVLQKFTHSILSTAICIALCMVLL